MSPWRGTGAASGHGRDIFGQMLGACVPAASRKRRAICLGAISKNCVTGLLSSPQGCHLPLICRAQEGAGIFRCKTRKSLSKREQVES